jgi:hypothetical protein
MPKILNDNTITYKRIYSDIEIVLYNKETRYNEYYTITLDSNVNPNHARRALIKEGVIDFERYDLIEVVSCKRYEDAYTMDAAVFMANAEKTATREV